MTMRKRIIGGAIAAISAAVLAAGCSADAQSAPQDHNDADVQFAIEMIPHHTQAIEMSALTPTRASSAQVKDLAERIEMAQEPEIARMREWLDEWSVDEPDSSASDDAHNSHSVRGMMTDEQMRELEQTSGAEFDKLFLEMMVEHHEGAIAMSQTQLDEGRSEPAKTLADQIIKAQEAEIEEMRALLGDG
jgi:uncharacterized protein (DUF305 family)